jgi:predicted nuclease of restriction endonuclease-like (RecB) superfamily
VSQIFGEKWSEKISQTLPDQLQVSNYKANTIRQSLSDESIKEKDDYFLKLLQSTSFSHFTELIKIDDHPKRRFYELLILKTTLSVRELQRQIQTLTYERFGLSQNKDVAFDQIQQKIIPEQSTDIVKSHYFFEFLDIKYPYLIEENELEQALINHLQEFIIELGNGFCFEARQKRVLIGDEYFFIDLVFYHRILKCHVLIDLKTEKAKHTHIGQLKAYVQHYKKTVMTHGDNPPVGILLVTDQNKTLVEYAIAESDKELFVSKYLLQLPNKEILESFINNELRNI